MSLRRQVEGLRRQAERIAQERFARMTRPERLLRLYQLLTRTLERAGAEESPRLRRFASAKAAELRRAEGLLLWYIGCGAKGSRSEENVNRHLGVLAGPPGAEPSTREERMLDLLCEDLAGGWRECLAADHARGELPPPGEAPAR